MQSDKFPNDFQHLSAAETSECVCMWERVTVNFTIAAASIALCIILFGIDSVRLLQCNDCNRNTMVYTVTLNH